MRYAAYLCVTLGSTSGPGVWGRRAAGSAFEAITAVAFEPDEGLERERVVETARPTVYAGGDVIQCGEVIVAPAGRATGGAGGA